MRPEVYIPAVQIPAEGGPRPGGGGGGDQVRVWTRGQPGQQVRYTFTTRRSILGSDCITLILLLSLLSECSLIAL